MGPWDSLLLTRLPPGMCAGQAMSVSEGKEDTPYPEGASRVRVGWSSAPLMP